MSVILPARQNSAFGNQSFKSLILASRFSLAFLSCSKPAKEDLKRFMTN